MPTRVGNCGHSWRRRSLTLLAMIGKLQQDHASSKVPPWNHYESLALFVQQWLTLWMRHRVCWRQIPQTFALLHPWFKGPSPPQPVKQVLSMRSTTSASCKPSGTPSGAPRARAQRQKSQRPMVYATLATTMRHIWCTVPCGAGNRRLVGSSRMGRDSDSFFSC